ncbi:MAG: hypothetical protein ACE5G0_23075 [Rhodothermales bacterium]
MISKRRLLVDGLLLSTLFSVIAVGSLSIDPTIHLENYPPDVRAAVADSIEPPVALQALVGGILVVFMLGGLIWSLKRLDRELGGIGFLAATFHVFLISWIVNAADVLIVDWFFFMTLPRSWIVLPGTEGLAGYDDYGFHFRESFLTLTPWVGSLVLSLGMGAGWWGFVTRRRAEQPEWLP